MSTPPPPPPHGEKRTPGHGLPDGKYDIFIIPPHSSGNGFLYLPSLQPEKTSFAVGCGCGSVVTAFLFIVVPKLKAWWYELSQITPAMALCLIVVAATVYWTVMQRSSNGPGPGGGGSGTSNAGYSYPFENGYSSTPGGQQTPPQPQSEPRSPPHSGQKPHDPPPQKTKGNASPPRPSPQSTPKPEQHKPQPRPWEQPNSAPEPEGKAVPTPEAKSMPTPTAQPEPERRPESRSRPQPGPQTSPAPSGKAQPESVSPPDASTAPPSFAFEFTSALPRSSAYAFVPNSASATELPGIATTRAAEGASALGVKTEAGTKMPRSTMEGTPAKPSVYAFTPLRNPSKHFTSTAPPSTAPAKPLASGIGSHDTTAPTPASASKAQAAPAHKATPGFTAKAQAKPSAFTRPNSSIDTETPKHKSKWEQAREETKRKEDERKAAEEARKRKEDLEAKLKEMREKDSREREAREKKAANAADKPKGSTYAFSATGQKEAPWPNGRPVTPTSPKKPPPPTARTYLGTEDEAYSFRPYDIPRTAPHNTSPSSIHSETSYAASQSTSRTTPPPSHHGPYSTKDPDKIVIKAVYAFNNAYMKTPVSQLVSGIGPVTDGLILRITTEGLFIDDDVRGVPQREWDIKAWTMKLVEVWCPAFAESAFAPATTSRATESGNHGRPPNPMRRLWQMEKERHATVEEMNAFVENLNLVCKSVCRLGAASASASASASDTSSFTTASSARSSSTYSANTGSLRKPNPRNEQTGKNEITGYHVLRASIRDQDGRRYVFVLREEEAWKVTVGLGKLRKGSQVRALGVSAMSAGDARATLECLGWV